jgi:aspartyl-tRNA(Asn)/glutamyl-tRNA(Gln) amidotransferase subunit A
MRQSDAPSEPVLPTVHEAARRLRTGSMSVPELVEVAFERARGPEARSVFIHRNERQAYEHAAAAGARIRGGAASELEGLPVSLKDLFDVAGEVTSAGSRVLAGAPAAERDSEVVRRLKAAGAVLIGRTNMTEFAFSGLGLNPHYGTPLNPYERAAARIPGGSSSGAAVSVAAGMAVAAIGTDTGGSVRIPAALCGLVGFKPTAARVPMRGVLPLSASLDSVGPIARTVRCCATLDAVLAGEEPAELPRISLGSVTLGVARNLVWEDVDQHVEQSVNAALHTLEREGARLIDCTLPVFDDILEVSAAGGFAAAESYAWHREFLREHAGEYDPRVRTRIERGSQISAEDYQQLLGARARVQGEFARQLPKVDAWLMPTVPRVAPRIAELGDDKSYFAANRLMLRNPALVNFLDGCAVSLPCHAPGTAPVGLSVVGARGADRRLLALAQAIEGSLANR